MDSRILSTIQSVFEQSRKISSSVSSIYRDTRNLKDKALKILHNQDKILEYIELSMMREINNPPKSSIVLKGDIVMFKEGYCHDMDRFRLFKVLTWLEQSDETTLVTVKPLNGDDSDRFNLRYNIDNFHKIKV